jgi:hypothetical protein
MRNINPIGILIVVVGVAASYCISIYQGLQLSPVAWIAAIYALIGAAAVSWELVGWHRCAHLLREGRTLAFVMNVMGLILASCVTILLFELAFLATALEGAASRNTVAIDNRAALEMERGQLQASLTKGGAARGVSAVISDIEGIKAHPRWASTHSCDPEWTTAKDSKALCERYSNALAELGLAKSTETAQSRIKAIATELTPLGQVGAADARSLYIGRILGTGEQGARVVVGFLTILFLLFCRSIASFVMWDAPTTKDSPAVHQEPIEARTAPNEAGGYAGSSVIVSAAPADNVAELERVETEEELIDRLNAEAIADLEAAMQEESAARGVEPRPEKIAANSAMVERVSSISNDDVEPIVRRFARECLVRDVEAREGATTLYRAFQEWATDSGLPGIHDQSLFGKAMTGIICGAPYRGEKRKSNGAWYYHNARLTPAAALRTESQHSGRLNVGKPHDSAILAISRHVRPAKRLDGRRRAGV